MPKLWVCLKQSVLVVHTHSLPLLEQENTYLRTALFNKNLTFIAPVCGL